MEIILSPSMLSADFGILKEQIEQIEKGGAKFLHIDVMDGVFVSNISYGLPVIQSLRKYTDMVFDVHLMITKPERYIDRFIDAGADFVTFHAEATDDIDKCIDIIKSRGIKAGIAISPKTPAETVMPYLDKIDMVLCMTVEPGYGGQSYIKDVEEKIRAIRAAAPENMYIQVDGGINTQNITEPIKAGANVIVAGSAAFKGNIEKSVKELIRSCAR